MRIKFSENEEQNIEILYVGKKVFSPGYIKDRDDFWEAAVKEGAKAGKSFWNGELYTFEGFLQYDLEKSILKLSSCEYRDRLFKKKVGAKNLQDIYGEDHLPIHCVAGCFPITTDKKIVVGIKKSSVGLDKNILGQIGGNLNKDELEVHAFDDITKTVLKEIEEETNIKVDFSKLKFNQIAHYNTCVNFEYIYNLDISSTSITSIYKDGEFIELLALTPSEIRNWGGLMLDDLKFSDSYIEDLVKNL